jgi:pantetheine-phosphate adenylyltransferase
MMQQNILDKDIIETKNRYIKTIAIYPGSFDPITYGHIDILRRALKFADVIVAIGNNTSKASLFSIEERTELIKQVLAKSFTLEELSKIKVDNYSSMLVDYAKKQNSKIIIRGIRTLTDFEFEFSLAGVNSKLDPSIETVFLLASEDKQFISSRFVADIAKFGGNLTSFVHPLVAEQLKQKFSK